MNNIGLRSILKDSMVTYKEHWRKLLIISSISALIGFLVNMFSMFILPVRFVLPKDLSSVLGVIIYFIQFYITSRLYVTLILTSNEVKKGEDVIFTEKFQESKQIIWKYIGISILISVMLYLPRMVLSMGLLNGDVLQLSYPIRGVLFIVGLIATLYIGTRFFFSSYIVILRREVSNVFLYSIKLVKDNFLLTLFVMLFPVLIYLPISLLGFYVIMNEVGRSIQMFDLVLSAIYQIIFAPFTVLITLSAMEKIELTKEIRGVYDDQNNNEA